MDLNTFIFAHLKRLQALVAYIQRKTTYLIHQPWISNVTGLSRCHRFRVEAKTSRYSTSLFYKKKKSKRKRSVPRKLYTQLNKKGRTSRLSASNQATSESSTRAGVFLSLSARMCVCRCVCVCVHDYRFNNVLWLEARAKILGSTIITNAIMDSRRNSSSSKYQRDPFFDVLVSY